jgi:hypothetical protein
MNNKKKYERDLRILLKYHLIDKKDAYHVTKLISDEQTAGFSGIDRVIQNIVNDKIHHIIPTEYISPNAALIAETGALYNELKNTEEIKTKAVEIIENSYEKEEKYFQLEGEKTRIEGEKTKIEGEKTAIEKVKTALIEENKKLKKESASIASASTIPDRKSAFAQNTFIDNLDLLVINIEEMKNPKLTELGKKVDDFKKLLNIEIEAGVPFIDKVEEIYKLVVDQKTNLSFHHHYFNYDKDGPNIEGDSKEYNFKLTYDAIIKQIIYCACLLKEGQ